MKSFERIPTDEEIRKAQTVPDIAGNDIVGQIFPFPGDVLTNICREDQATIKAHDPTDDKPAQYE